jgi:hypothetical protein
VAKNIKHHGTPTQALAVSHQKPEKQTGKLLPNYTKPTIPFVRWFWEKSLKKKFGNILMPAAVHYGQLKLLRNELGPATLRTVEYTIEHWQEFAKTVTEESTYEVGP